MQQLITANEARKYITENNVRISEETQEVIDILSCAILNLEREVEVHLSDVWYNDETISFLRKRGYDVEKQWDDRYDWTIDHWIVITF